MEESIKSRKNFSAATFISAQAICKARGGSLENAIAIATGVLAYAIQSAKEHPAREDGKKAIKLVINRNNPALMGDLRYVPLRRDDMDVLDYVMTHKQDKKHEASVSLLTEKEKNLGREARIIREAIGAPTQEAAIEFATLVLADAFEKAKEYPKAEVALLMPDNTLVDLNYCAKPILSPTGEKQQQRM